MKGTSIPPGSELDQAASAVIEAFRKYREVMKRDARHLLGGVIWIEAGTEFVFYSENQRYTGRLKKVIDEIDDVVL